MKSSIYELGLLFVFIVSCKYSPITDVKPDRIEVQGHRGDRGIGVTGGAFLKIPFLLF